MILKGLFRRASLAAAVVASVLAVAGCAPWASRLGPMRDQNDPSFAAGGAQAELPGRLSEYEGYPMREFFLGGRTCIVVAPHHAAPGRPWLWRAGWWAYAPQVELELLSRGFHLVWMDVDDLYGAPRAVAAWDVLYRFLTERHGLALRPALMGIGPGALTAYRWAAIHPDRVACIYADGAVCDYRSWPGPDHPEAWARVLEAYGLSDEEARSSEDQPINQLAPLARAGVPLLHVVSDGNDVAPVSENTALVAERYRQLGGDILVIVKEGADALSHGLKDPAPIVAFVFHWALVRNGVHVVTP